MRRLLSQAANAAVKTKGSIFEFVYRRMVPRLGHAQTIGAIAHRQYRLIWLILAPGSSDTKNGAQRSPRNRRKNAPPECSGSFETSAIGSNHTTLNSAKHKRSDLRAIEAPQSASSKLWQGMNTISVPVAIMRSDAVTISR
jgi:hypothetical protein